MSLWAVGEGRTWHTRDARRSEDNRDFLTSKVLEMLEKCCGFMPSRFISVI
jgi:hypothetical protein